MNNAEASLLRAAACAVLTATLLAQARGGSTTNSATVSFGPFATSNWRSEDFAGTCRREWTDTADVFRFTWNTTAGNQIGSIGVAFGSSYLQNASWEGVRIADVRPGCRMSTEASWTPANGGWFFWSIYGWTHEAYTYWGSPDARDGFDNEFYIIFYTQQRPGDFLSQPGCVARGSVEVDGMTFDCFATPRTSQSQWFAVCRTNAWNREPSVDLKKIFDYWCSQGLSSNQYVMSLSWALEGFGGSAGTLQLTNTAIPDLTP